MNLYFLSRRFRRLNIPGAILITLLQRTPVLQFAGEAESIIIASPVGSVVRAAIAAVASMGAMQTMVGATPLVPTSGTASGITVTTGTSITVAYTVSGTQTSPASWKIAGTVPDGLNFSGLNGPGIVNVTTLTLTGTPTTAGVYNLTITAYEGTNATLVPSPDYPYTITVASGTPPPPPAISTQPKGGNAVAGGTLILSVSATGAAPITYQWKKDNSSIPGATSSTYTKSSVAASDAGTYAVSISNPGGTTVSNDAVVTVSGSTGGVPPAFSLQPVSVTVATGSTASLSAAASGAPSYQWQLNNVNISGATNSTLLIPNATAANQGSYTAVATNGNGSVTSSAATLTVQTVSAANTGHLSNLSVRTFSGTGDQLLNVGFAVGGGGTTGNKPLLVRVTGPALVPFGVTGTMADPTLSIQPLGSTTIIASNDNWAGDATVTSTGNAVGAFPLSDSSSLDAAVVTSVGGGACTVLAAGKNSTTGIVLTEIYDATPSSSITTTTPRLINVSARAQVGTGDGVLIAGFAVAGSTARTLLIRATGPTLASFGVGGTLADPLLQIFQLNGPKLYSNDNWGGSAAVTQAGTSVGAFAISDPNSKDSALVVTLPPGVYTAEVSGADGGTGVALVEVYEVP